MKGERKDLQKPNRKGTDRMELFQEQIDDFKKEFESKLQDSVTYEFPVIGYIRPSELPFDPFVIINKIAEERKLTITFDKITSECYAVNLEV